MGFSGAGGKLIHEKTVPLNEKKFDTWFKNKKNL
jgi:hypothetical protein